MADLRQEIDRAQRASDLLNNKMLKEAFELLEKELIEGLIATPVDKEVTREKIHMMLAYGRKWKGYLTNIIETGKLATLQLDEKRKFRVFGGS